MDTQICNLSKKTQNPEYDISDLERQQDLGQWQTLCYIYNIAISARDTLL